MTEINIVNIGQRLVIATKLKSFHICSKCVENHATFVRRVPNHCLLPFPNRLHDQQVKRLNLNYKILTYAEFEKISTSIA